MLFPALLPLALAGSDCAPAATASGQDPVDAAQGNVITWINTGDAPAMFARFSAPMQAAVPLSSTEGLVNGLLVAGGCIVKSERISGTNVSAAYRLTTLRTEWRLDLNVDAGGTVQGLSVTRPSPEPPVSRTTLDLRFPVEGAWTVFWGGDTAELNAHIGHKSQRRAADLLIFDATGKSHTGDGTKVTDYYAYGKAVNAVAPGTVVVAIEGVPESTLGQLNPYFALGNAVIIDHGGVYSVVAHLQRGSVKVKVGDKVKAGALLGLCGNTGNSSEPHLHFQLMDGPVVEASYGVEAVFPDVSVVRGGQAQADGSYTFRKGDVVTRKGSK